MKNQDQKKIPGRLVFSTLFVFMVLLFSIAGYFYYKNEIVTIKKEKTIELKIIVELKIHQIQDWYDDELDDARTITKNLFYSENYEELGVFMNNAQIAHLRKQLSYLKEEHGYEEIFIVNPKGKLVTSTSDTIPYFENVLIETMHNAIQTHTTISSDFYLSNGNLYIDFITPIEDQEGKVCGAAIFRQDAKAKQYTLISFWPTNSKSSETILFRREKDSVLYVSELRFIKNAALQINLPANQIDYVSVKAVNGYIGPVEGKDYRGTDVFAYLSPVQHTPWFIIAKIDKEELLMDIYYKIWAVCIIIFLFILFIGMGISYVFANKRKNLYKTLWQTQEEYRTILYSIGDAVIITDKNGRVMNMNPVAEQCTGWSEIEAQNEPLEKVFNIIDEETRQKVPDPVKMILQSGLTIGLANHTLLISKKGGELPIADSGAPIKDTKGEIVGIVIVFRDQLDERIRQKYLEENDKLIRAIMDNLPIGIAVNSVSPDVMFNYMNDNFPKIYRTTRDDLSKYDAFWDSVYEDPEFREQMKKRVLDDCTSGNPDRMIWDEIPITRKGKETTYVSARNIPISDKNLQISTVWDITDQVKAQKEVRDSERKFRSLFENNSSVKFIIDATDGSIIDANEAASIYYGWSIEELKNMKISQINTLDIEVIKEKLRVAGTENNTHFEFKHRLKSGEIRDVESFSSKIEVSGKYYVYSIVNDITDKKRAEKQIKLLSRSIEQSPVIVVITDKNGNIEYVNPKFEMISGYKFDEVKGKNMRIFKSGTHTSEFYEVLWSTILAGKDWQGEIQNKKKNGELYWENCLISPIIDEQGNIAHYIAVKEDITEDKKMLEDLIIAKERAEESDRLKTAFLANMSHEIRTPLNGIVGFIELLGNPNLTADQHTRFNSIIKKSSDRLLSTINDIIEISKIESGQLQLNLSYVDINEIMQYLFGFFKPEAETKKISLLCPQLLPQEQPAFYTDRNKLESVLINLLKNAIKFTTRGTIEFGCSLSDNYIEFFVKDTGMGIAENKQQAVFNRFVQGDTSITNPHEGSGLGLSISKAYIEKLGGKIWIESKVGKGTTFFFNIQKELVDG